MNRILPQSGYERVTSDDDQSELQSPNSCVSPGDDRAYELPELKGGSYPDYDSFGSTENSLDEKSSLLSSNSSSNLHSASESSLPAISDVDLSHSVNHHFRNGNPLSPTPILNHPAPPHVTAASKKEKGHKTGSKYVKTIIYGGLDGIITTFNIISTSFGAGYHAKQTALLSVAALIAGCISMAMGEYLSEKAERDAVLSEKKRELWEIQIGLEGEKEEMVEIYQQQGLSNEDSTELVDIYSQYPDIFADVMLVHELNITPREEDEGCDIVINGVVMFFAFLIFGSVPVWVYLIMHFVYDNLTWTYIISSAATALSTFLLGAAKSRYTQETWFREGLQMVLNGGAATLMAYILGYSLDTFFGLDESSLPP